MEPRLRELSQVQKFLCLVYFGSAHLIIWPENLHRLRRQWPFVFIGGSRRIWPIGEGLENGSGEHIQTDEDETEGFGCLGHSNWAICSLLSKFCSENFQLFHFHTGEPILITSDG